jgi:hypothetical protein
MKRTWSVAAAVLLASGVVFGQTGPAEVAAAKPAGLPPGVLGVVEFASVETLQKHVTDFLTATGAFPSGEIPTILEIFDEPLHSTDPSQMDIAHPVRFVLVKGSPREIEAVLQCTVKDAAVYRSTLAPGLKKGEEKDGVTTYTQDQQTVAIGESGNRICVGENAAAVGQVLALVNSNALPPEAMLEGGDVVARIEVKALLGHLADEKGNVLGGLKEGLKNLVPTAPGGPEQSQAGQRAIEAEVDAFETVLKQVERATVSFSPDAQEIKLSAKVEPVQGGRLASYLATVPSGVPATLKYMPEDAFAVCAFKVGNVEPLITRFVAFSTNLLTQGGVEPSKAASLSDQGASALKALGDDMAFALRSGQGIRAVSAMAFKDPEVYKALLQKMPEFFGTLAGFYRGLGMPLQIKSEVVKYEDREITELKWTLEEKPAAGAAPEQEAMAEAQQKAMKAMFGEGMTQDAVILGKDAVNAQGSDSLETIKQIIDGKLKKLADGEDFKKMAASIPADSCGFCLVHLTGLAEFGLGMARTLGGPAIPDIHFQRGPGVMTVFVTAPAGSSVTCNVHVPAAEIKAIVDGFKSLSAPPAPGPGAPPPQTPVPPAAAPPETPAPPVPEK